MCIDLVVNVEVKAVILHHYQIFAHVSLFERIGEICGVVTDVAVSLNQEILMFLIVKLVFFDSTLAVQLIGFTIEVILNDECVEVVIHF